MTTILLPLHPTRHRSPAWLRRALAACLAGAVLLLSGCGGGGVSNGADAGTGTGGTTGNTGTDTTVVRLDVAPRAMMLTAAGQSRKLEVHAFNAAGDEVALPALTFTSSRPVHAGVAADGTVSAVVDAGSALVTVSAGTVAATPLLVTVAQPAAGVVLVGDDQVVSAPVVVAPAAGADPDAPAQLRFTLSGVGVPAPGTLMLGTGGQPVVGRVLSATAAAGNADVVVELAPLPQLFRNLSIDLLFSPEQTTPWIQMAASHPRALSVSRAQGLDPAAVCKGGISPGLVTLTNKLKVTPAIDLGLKYSLVNGSVNAFHVSALGALTASGSLSTQVALAVTGSLKCKIPLGKIIVPIDGPLSLLIAPVIPIEARAEFQLTLANDGFSASADMTQKATMSMALDYAPGTGLQPTFGGSLDDLQPKLALDFAKTSVRAQASGFFGLGTGISIGNLLASLEVVDASAGPQLDASFGSPYDVSQDAGFDAGYKLKGKLAVGPGADIKKAMKLVLGELVSVSTGFGVDTTLASTPKMVASSIDHASFAVGDTVAFKVRLDPTTTDFPIVGYNVKEVRIYRLIHADPTGAQLVATAVATAGQTDFDLTWTADVAGVASDAVSDKATFYAFVVDNVLYPVSSTLPFELGEIVDSVQPALFRLAATGTAMFAIQGNGRIAAIGTNSGGALGAGLPIGQVATGPVTVVNAANVVSVTGSAWFGAALTGDGSVYAWGWGTAIGSGSQNNPMPFVTLTSPPNDRIVSISSGYRSTATVSTSGLVYRYGDTSGRSLADTRPGAVAAAEGYSHTMVLTSGGKVYGWGDNTLGQIGTGQPAASYATSTEVAGLSKVVAIAAGDNFTLALRKDGTVWSWGSNNRGQLGLGPDAVTGSVYSATQIPGLAGIRKISAGETHALALATDGTVYAWGLGDFCRLGTGDSATRNAPVAVATGVSDIDAGEFSSIFNIGGAIWRAGRTPGLNGDACALQPTLLGGS